MITRLGVVDQSPITQGSDGPSALANSIDLAQRCEALGYGRYWVAEHHSSVALAGSAPEIMIGRLAAATETMRIGAGGVMLTHYSSYKVAEQFRVLQALFPDRIDLGIGRAPGSDQTTAAALAKGPGALSSEHYPAQVMELCAFLEDRPDPAGPFRDVRASPICPESPPVFLLASSQGSASIAAHLGMPLVWAHFIAFEDGRPIVDAYRRNYQPSPAWPEPVVMVATGAVCAETQAQADRLATTLEQWRAAGLRGPFPPPLNPQTPEPKPVLSDPLRIVGPTERPLLRGTPDHVRSELESLAAGYGSEEVLVVTITFDHQARVRSYELLAQAFDL